MKNKLLHCLLFTCLLLSIAFTSSAQRNWLSTGQNAALVSKEIAGITTWRERQAEQVKSLLNQIPDSTRQQLIHNGEKYLSFEWPNLPATVFLQFAENGNRSHYEAMRGKRRAALSALVVAELLEHKGRFIPQIINGIWAICEESTWALPAHLSLQHHYTPLPNPGENIVDLGAEETASLMSWTYLLLKDQLAKVTPVIPARMQYELERRIIKPYLDRDDFWWMGFHGQRVNNWNPWCNHNVLVTALLTENDSAELVNTVYKTMRSVDNFINQYPDDGGCDEGPAYWSHAGGQLIQYLDILTGASHGRIDITGKPLIGRMGKYIEEVHIAGRAYVDFADSHPYLTPDVASVFNFGKAAQDDTLKQFAAWLANEGGSASQHFIPLDYNLGEFINYLKIYPEIIQTPAKESLLQYAWFPDLEVLTARAHAGSSDGLFLAAKGGTNGESHNHNDVGNFILYVNGKPAIIDIGVGTYTKETFSKDRYKIFTMQSAWHNLPTINGIMQHEGLSYRATDVKFEKQGNDYHFSMNIADTYPKEAGVKSWMRSMDFIQGKKFILTEKYALEKYTRPFTLSLITPLRNIQVKKDKIVIQSDDNTYGLQVSFDSKQFDVKVEKKPLTDPALKEGWGDALYRILLVDKTHRLQGKYKISFEQPGA